jgi:hypothetical protein
MEIKRDVEFEKHILDTVKTNWINKVRTDIALTDLIYPREAYLKRIYIKEPSETQILDFLRGKSIEEGLGKLLKMKHPESKLVEGIWYNPDFRFEYLDKENIMELKSRRSYLAKEGEEETRYSYYLKQMKGYCTLDKRNDMKLTVFSIAEKADDGYRTEPRIVCYSVHYDDNELEEHMEELKKLKDDFNLTIEDGDFTRLPECDSSRCGITHKNMLKNPFCETCNKSFSSDYFLNRHFKGQSGKGHIGKYGIYEYKFEPRCNWIEECKPKIWRELNEV